MQNTCLRSFSEYFPSYSKYLRETPQGAFAMMEHATFDKRMCLLVEIYYFVQAWYLSLGHILQLQVFVSFLYTCEYNKLYL